MTLTFVKTTKNFRLFFGKAKITTNLKCDESEILITEQVTQINVFNEPVKKVIKY